MGLRDALVVDLAEQFGADDCHSPASARASGQPRGRPAWLPPARCQPAFWKTARADLEFWYSTALLFSRRSHKKRGYEGANVHEKVERANALTLTKTLFDP